MGQTPRAGGELRAEDGMRDAGPYRIEAVLGRGGMGVVYRGDHRESGQPVAIKTIHAPLEEHIAGIRREIQALAQLDHPGVVRIVSSGEVVTPHVQPWYAMELLEGSTLRDQLAGARLKSGPRPVAETETLPDAETGDPGDAPSLEDPPAVDGGSLTQRLELLQRVCDSLAYLHSRGIVHRDLKPENIFIRTDGRPVLVDLGIAGRFGGKRGREELQGAGGGLGTYAYMAPEQIRGEFVDARADLYSLGCVLYECLTGEPPFSGGRPFAVAQAHLHRAPRPPSELVEDIPSELDRLVLRLLEKAPENRFGYAADVAAALGLFVGAASNDVGRDPAPYLYRPPFVGRSAPQQRLMRSIRDVCLRRTGGSLFLGGPTGIGKTRLAMEGLRIAEGLEARVIVSRCVSSETPDAAAGDVPLMAFAPLLLAAAEHCLTLPDVESERFASPWCKVLAPYQPALERIPGYEMCPEPPELGPQAAQARVLQALSEAVLRFAESRPLVLVVDDLQWADELSLASLRLLQQGNLADTPVLVVATFRSDEGGHNLADVVKGPGAESIALPPFGAADVEAMVQGMLAAAALPASLVEFLHRHCVGNPFFVVQYLHAAISEGLLTRSGDGHWALGVSTQDFDFLSESLPLPESLSGVIRHRFQDLDENARRLASTGALLGREFDVALASSCASLAPSSVDASVRSLLDAHVVEEVAGNRLQFVHDGLRNVAQALLDEAERSALHRRAALAVETESRLDPSVLELRYAKLGRLWAAAGEHRTAANYYLLAGRRARAAYAHREAATFFATALHQNEKAGPISPPAEAWEPLLHEDIGDLMVLLGRQAEAAASFEGALPGARSPLDHARIHRKIGKTHEVHHRHKEALASYQMAEVSLGTSPPDGDDAASAAWWNEWMDVQASRVMVHYWLASEVSLEEVVDRIRSAPSTVATPQKQAQFFKSLALSNIRRERFALSAQTVSYVRDRLRAVKEWGDEGEIVESQFMLAFTLLWHGSVDEAVRVIGEALAGEQRADATTHARFLAYLAVGHGRLGDVDATRDAATRCMAVAKASNLREYIGTAHAKLGWVAWREGFFVEARTHCLEAIDAWSGVSLVYPFKWLARLVLIALDGTEAPERAEHARRILDPEQQKLPEELTKALEALAVQPDTPHDAAHFVTEAAKQLGYL